MKAASSPHHPPSPLPEPRLHLFVLRLATTPVALVFGFGTGLRLFSPPGLLHSTQEPPVSPVIDTGGQWRPPNPGAPPGAASAT